MRARPTLITLAYCGTAQVEGYDCPDASQLKAGVSLRCGGSEIVGTLEASPALKACAAPGEVEEFCVGVEVVDLCHGLKGGNVLGFGAAEEVGQ